MTMKVINVTELKAHLSKYLRLASNGVRITVNDRDEPVAELGPPSAESSSWRDRLIQSGRLRPGTQQWTRVSISPISRQVDIQGVLAAVREDPSEVHRR